MKKGNEMIKVRLTTSVAACVSVMGTCVSAHAATASLTWQVSVNGGPFSATGSALPGDFVIFRLRVNLTGNTGVGSIGGAGGLAGFNFLPTLSGVGPNDNAVPLNAEQFPEGSVNNPFPGVINHPDLGTITNVYQGSPTTFRGPGNVGGTGRNAPWGSNGTNTNGVATSSVAAGVLSWRAGVIGNAGVSLSQLNANNSSISAVTGIDDAGTPGDTSDDGLIVNTIGSFANNGRTNLFVFSYRIDIGFGDERVLIADSAVLTPVQWFTSAAGASAAATNVQVTQASIMTGAPFPAPGGVALLGLAGAFTARRRR
jgi:MYXO-CTERM domain-containing protein